MIKDEMMDQGQKVNNILKMFLGPCDDLTSDQMNWCQPQV